MICSFHNSWYLPCSEFNIEDFDGAYFLMDAMRVIVTGGAGFIGSALVRTLINDTDARITVVDKLTYAGTLESLNGVLDHPRLQFVQGDIRDRGLLSELFRVFRPDRVMHLAAESHVDRSIDSPLLFAENNVVGTVALLQAACEYWHGLPEQERGGFRFLHVSTDEVYGSAEEENVFNEDSNYAPHSPYSASKAAADHFVRAWHCTYGFPVVITNCSNNYGPRQFPEKLIPLTVINALEGRVISVYGDGSNVRDWLHVEDHVRALLLAVDRGKSGRTYNIGGSSEKSNIRVVETVCRILDELRPRPDDRKYSELISFVDDRPGHDRRYAIDASRISNELGWRPSVDFESGLRSTVQWYLDNEWWWRPIREKLYDGHRLGKPSEH